MRKFKFRIWHKTEKRWLDPWAEEDPMLCLKDCGQGCEVYLYERDTGDWSNKNCQIKDLIIQQYTGLIDRSGREIYEGDIINNHEEYNNIKVVNYDHYRGYFCLMDIDNWPNKKYNGEMFNVAGEGSNFQDKIEVVGNICENQL